MVNEVTLTWADGQSLSAQTVDCTDLEKAIGIFFEAGFNTTKVTFQAIMADDKVANVKKADASEYEITVTPAQPELISLDPSVFAGINKFRVRRGTYASPFTTGAEDTKIAILRRQY